MLDDNLDDALAALEAALDPDRLAEAMLEDTGRALVAYDEQVGPWTDRTGELRRSFRYETGRESKDEHFVEEENTADHAVYVEAKEGLSVLTAMVDGSAERILRQAFDRHRPRGEV